MRAEHQRGAKKRARRRAANDSPGKMFSPNTSTRAVVHPRLFSAPESVPKSAATMGSISQTIVAHCPRSGTRRSYETREIRIRRRHRHNAPLTIAHLSRYSAKTLLPTMTPLVRAKCARRKTLQKREKLPTSFGKLQRLRRYSIAAR
jgi:hypothetical protein